jgi:hypothetical protein
LVLSTHPFHERSAMKPMRAFGAIVMVATAVTSCTDAATSDSGSIPQTPAPFVLGPVDGHDLSGIEVDRVQVGHEAPDFTLTSLAGPTGDIGDPTAPSSSASCTTS